MSKTHIPFAPQTEGLFHMDMATYAKAPGVRKSMLLALERSPAHLQAYLQAPPQEPSDALIFGNLMDHALLEPDLFAEGKSHWRKPEGLKFTTKDGIAYRDSRLEVAALPFLRQRDEQDIGNMLERLLAHPIVGNIVRRGRTQESIFVYHQPTGVLRKGRPDKVCESDEGTLVIADLKTAIDASLDGFVRAIHKFAYHVQAAYYLDMYRDLMGTETGEPFFMFVAVEKTPPYAIGCYNLDSATLEAGREFYARNLERYARCVKENNWPAYAQNIQTIGLSKWQLNPQSALRE